MCSLTDLLAAGRDNPCFSMTSRTLAFRSFLPPPDTPEPTARSCSLVALTVIFACICCGLCPCILSKSLRFSPAFRRHLALCLRRLRFVAAVEAPRDEAPAAQTAPAEGPAAETPAGETPAADRPLQPRSLLSASLLAWHRPTWRLALAQSPDPPQSRLRSRCRRALTDGA